MNGYLLDTNVCIHLIKGEYNIKEKIIQIGIQNAYLSEITIAELLFGIENSTIEHREKNRQNLQNLQTLFQGRIQLIGPAFYEYAQQKAALRRMGRPVDEFDLLIGATALVYGFTLVTRNTRHFENMTGLQLENWIDLQ
jgi:tRNA(fMet)-specific endonuclease VapC